MSRRTFRYGNYQVTGGWDRHLQHTFLTVEDLYRKPELVFCNLTQRENPAMTVGEVGEVLDKLGIRMPPTFLDDLAGDKANDAGNTICVYERIRRDA